MVRGLGGGNVMHVDRRSWPERALEGLDEAPDSVVARALTPLSWLYAAGAAALRWIRPDRPLATPPVTIGVGNLRVGGTGKSPVVADLAGRLADEGRRVVVVSRGFRAEGGGDEPQWFEERGHVVLRDPDRRRAVRAARAAGADVVVLDDALQTRDRPRLTLALVLGRDLRRAPRCLPAGPAREGRRALRRADQVVVRLEGDDRLPEGRTGFRLVPEVLRSGEGQERPLEALPELGPVLAVSGIARPASFEDDARRAGARVAGVWRETDHWRPSPQDRQRLERAVSESGARAILCPEKNLRRLGGIGLECPLWALGSRIVWEGGVDPLSALGIRQILDG